MKKNLEKIIKNKNLMIGISVGIILSFFVTYYLLQINISSSNFTQGDINKFDKVFQENGTVLYSKSGIEQESFDILDEYMEKNKISEEMIKNMMKIVFNPENDVLGLITESGMIIAGEENINHINNMVSVDYEYIKEKTNET